MEKSFLKILYGVCLLLIASLLSAQPKYLHLNTLTTDQGLSSSTVLSFQQDQKGFMWIGTLNGLNRYYDGNFMVYKKVLNDSLSIADNVIHSLFLDDNDQLFIGTNAGLSRYDSENDCFINYRENPSSCLYKVFFQLLNITQYNDGIYLLSTNIGFILFDEENNEYSIEKDKALSYVSDVLVDSDARIWVATSTGVGIFNLEQRTFFSIKTKEDTLQPIAMFCSDLVQDNDGFLWAASSTKGVFKIDPQTFEYTQFKHSDNDASSLSKNRILGMQVDTYNNLWIGAENDGLFLFNRDENTFTHFLSSAFDPFSLNTYSIECLSMDNTGNVWLGTYSDGVKIVSNNSESIISYKTFKGKDHAVQSNVVSSFAEGEKGILWIGTEGGGLNKLDMESGFFTNYNTTNSALSSNYIVSICTDNNGYLWLATWGEGLIRYNPKNHEFKTFNKSNSNISGNRFFSVINGENNDLWLGSYNSGIVRFNISNQEFTSYTDTTLLGNSYYVNVLRMGDDGMLYVGTNTNLYLFNPQTEELISHGVRDTVDGGMINQHIYDLLVENDSSIWLATLKGLCHYNPKSKENVKFILKNNLQHNVIRGIVKDNYGNKWLSTSSGICRLDSVINVDLEFAKEDGLQSNEFRPRSVFCDHNGGLYFGGVNGFDVIYPDKIETNKSIPNVVITGFDLFNESVIPNGLNSPLKRIISETEQINLNHNQSVITFHFGVMDYTKQNKNKHAYMLENFDKTWTYCGNRKSATYTNLDPGKYIFRVKGANNDGVWNEEGTSLNITILPPWWATWWFRVMLYVGITILILSGFFIRISVLNKQKRKLEETVEIRTKELASINTTKDKLFSIIAHDLRNPFNIILGYSDLLLNNYADFDDETMLEILTDLNYSGKSAFSLLENLLNWARTQREVIEFSPEEISISSFIDDILDEINAFSKRKSIQVKNNIANVDIVAFADENMMQLIFRNIISNAIKFSKAESEINIDIHKVGHAFITFSIADKGKGMDASKMKTLFNMVDEKPSKGTEGEKGSGLGLILVKEFVEKHGGKVWVESQLQKGSTFFFTIPKQ